MANLINLPVFTDDSGNLAVVENILPETIRRIFFIEGKPLKKRGGHRHKKTTHLLICMIGSCKIHVNSGSTEFTYLLRSKQQGLLIPPDDWREMFDFSEDCILMCISNSYYDADDYIYQPFATLQGGIPSSDLATGGPG
ncbi:sugar 3,4-ketoisomerase [Arundinibacter roseus]|uniref:WxcM-like domain-containing protein n=1 Tax=Arundinibacter roseus TaxID=2070510 RepID=A0A4R4K5K8_9BACT|nr:FdtA/QdtA family cupin domain-containing protein [Arundinibacter roseus]TDB62777.1 WxcM-like domain-containing protein [Arundinibacter roseus]